MSEQPMDDQHLRLIEAIVFASPNPVPERVLAGRLPAGTDLAVAITGIAGPAGGSPEKPVGLVFVGLADRDGVRVFEHRLGEQLSRAQVRDRTVKIALNRLRLGLLRG